MLQIVNDLSDVIMDNDSFFDVNTINLEFTAKDLELIRLIDCATIEGDRMVTPFGYANVDELSTGCKTLLNCIHYPEKKFYVGSCGENVLSIIFNSLNVTVGLDYAASCKLDKDTAFICNDRIYKGPSGYVEFWDNFYESRDENDF